MSFVELLLTAWSVCAAGWWAFACWLVTSPAKRRSEPWRNPDVRLSFFKSIPPVSSPAERAALASAVANFLPQLGLQDEMLIGVLESEAANWAPTDHAASSQSRTDSSFSQIQRLEEFKDFPAAPDKYRHVFQYRPQDAKHWPGPQGVTATEPFHGLEDRLPQQTPDIAALPRATTKYLIC